MILENEDVFFDFYFSLINQEEREKLLSYKNTYRDFINKFELDKNKIYFDVKDLYDNILDFILEISYNEYLFSTFYFKYPNMTLWTNYNKQFILFFKDKTLIEKYKNIAKDFKLNILFENMKE